MGAGEVIARLIVAAFAGATIGWERESDHKPAGLRTHILVTLGAAAFMLCGLQFHQELANSGFESGDDIFKLMAGIVGGVGFLGAGSIMRADGTVKGLTTAATIWLAASIGIACGMGYFVIAATSVVLALVVLQGLAVIERAVFPSKPSDKDGPPDGSPPSSALSN
jgi:putative Mg2+ transporter-C (MgtC) family protein